MIVIKPSVTAQFPYMSVSLSLFPLIIIDFQKFSFEIFFLLFDDDGMMASSIISIIISACSEYTLFVLVILLQQHLLCICSN